MKDEIYKIWKHRLELSDNRKIDEEIEYRAKPWIPCLRACAISELSHVDDRVIAEPNTAPFSDGH